jgi:hypothetical protein
MSITVPLLAAEQVFPHANIVAGVLVLIVGFGFHFLGQLYSLLNLEGAIELGIQEADMPEEYRAYELGIAVADVLIGWTYAIAGVGLIADASWAYVWAWIPGVALTYHGLSHWFWTRNQQRAGYDRTFTRWPARHIWLVANLTTGLLAIAVASSQIVVTP